MYYNIFNGYVLVSNYTNAIESGTKLLALLCEAGDRRNEGTISLRLARLYDCQYKYEKSKELYMRALRIMIETGNRIGQARCYENLGSTYFFFCEYFEAKEYLQKALVTNKKFKDKNGKALCYANLGAVFHSLGEYLKAKEYLQKALEIYKQTGDKNREAACYANLGPVFYSLGEYLKAEVYLQKAVQINKQTGDKNREAACYAKLGAVFHSLGEYVKAEEYVQKALEINKQTDKNMTASCYKYLGYLNVSLGEYLKAKEYLQKALVIANEIGQKEKEAACFTELGTMFTSRGEYVKAEEHLQKALVIQKEIGVENKDASIYQKFGSLFISLGEYVKAKEYNQRALAIAKNIGNKSAEATGYANLGTGFVCLGKYVKAKEYLQKALAIKKEIGDKAGEASSYALIGNVSISLKEYDNAEVNIQKSLQMFKEIGHKKGEARCYQSLGTVFSAVRRYLKAKEYFEKSLALSHDIGCIELQLESHLQLTCVSLVLNGDKYEGVSSLLMIIQTSEKMRTFLRDHDQFKISLLDMHVPSYQMLSFLFSTIGKAREALYVAELGRARALADLISPQYSVKQQTSVNPESSVDLGNMIKKEDDCCCLFVAYFLKLPTLSLWAIKPNKIIFYRQKDINDCFSNIETERSVEEVFGDESFRKFHDLSAPEHCEDRSLSFSSHSGCLTSRSSQGDDHAATRLVEETEDENQYPEPPSLSQCYEMIIAPLADFLNQREIIIVPNRIFYKVPFAALKDENDTYLSETFRIRIVPSLTTLKLIQDSPADYHSDTGALIVGEPAVSNVFYKGSLEKLCALPGARKEAEMIGRLLGTQPLLGEQATKQTVLQRMQSVSLIHFAAYGHAERGEIALAPPPSCNGIPEEGDYLLTMAEIARVRLRAKLVVLSCCHSARGQIRSEGVVGIARAFLGSGARSVLVALWAIQDEATEQLMSRFYEHLVRGESASESLHQAMKWMRGNGFPEIGQWAPFMLIGDNVTFDFGK